MRRARQRRRPELRSAGWHPPRAPRSSSTGRRTTSRAEDGLLRLVSPDAPWTWVGGKGGVGKTTVAAALAVTLADRGERVLALSLDPAHSLGDALCARLGPEPAAVPGTTGLAACEVDAEHERAVFLARHGQVLRRLAERGTYLALAEVDELLDLTIPGMDEVAALVRLVELVRLEAYDRIVVDTAPTGHTLRLLALPGLALGWLAALEALEARHLAVARTFAPAFESTDTRRFLDELRSGIDALAALLRDPRRTRFLLVTTPEPVVAAETLRYREALAASGLALGGLVVNRAAVGEADDSETEAVGDPPRRFVPVLAEAPCCADGLRRFAAHAVARPTPVPTETGRRTRGDVRVGEPYFPPPDRRLYVVAGKGGVGKTTTASALALRLAHGGSNRIVLLSTDPAGSLCDVWETEVGAAAVPAPDAPGLELRQLDAAADWAAFRTGYATTVERVFAAGAAALTPDREVVRRFVDLAPPGVDEVMALRLVIDLLAGRVYNAVVLDSAPTGHLLRLLQMPQLALDWCHSGMRLLLRFREVVGLGDLAEQLLGFAGAVRGLRELMLDRRRACVLVVALADALGLAETRRLLPRLAGLGLPAEVMLINRILDAGAGVIPGAEEAITGLLDAASEAGAVAAAAPRLVDGPRGAAGLEQFSASWRRLAAGAAHA